MSRRASAILLIPLLLTSCQKHQQPPPPALTLSPQIIARSRLSDGNLARLDRVLQKCQRGQPITIGFFGGSITAGQGASQPQLTYTSLLTNWWAEKFPQSKLTVVNAGIKGTGSPLGCLRVQHDLLSHHPDFVIVEFGVNDRADLPHAQTYEGVVRQIMADPDQPAVLLAFTMHHDGTNAQEYQGEIGRRYQLPMISFRDALWPEMTAGQLHWADVIADSIHPNDRGHAAIATFIESLLNDAITHQPAEPGPVPPMPPPRYTDIFARTRFVDAEHLTPLTNHGWTLDTATNCWQSDKPGSTIEFVTSGPLIDLLYGRVIPNAGTASVTVDDLPPLICDAWFDGTWEGYTQVDVVARNLSPGPHRVRVELVDEQNKLSHGHDFRIVGLATAGR